MADQHRLHYKTPSTTFPTSLPLGNGRLAASVLSSPAQESFILNEVTFWSGAPHVAGSGLKSRASDPKAELRKTQQCYLDGDYAEGKKRSEKYLETNKHNFGTNLGVGKLDIDVVGHGADAQVTGFERELRLDEALAVSRYEKGHKFTRRSFVSYPHQVLVAKFETDDPQGLEIVISLRGENDAFAATSKEDILEFTAQALENIHSDGTCGVKGHGVVSVKTDTSDVVSKDGKMTAKGNKVTVLLALNTDYRKTGNAWKHESFSQIEAASKLSVDDLLSAHLADYQPIYNRTSITLGPTTSQTSALTTDQRRQKLEPSGYADPGMFSLYFHYARYLTIAGTRATSPLPLHLQGLWNDGEACRMGWSCDYHLDINIQMNYFPTMPSSLSDLMQPMVQYLSDLSVAGGEAAKVVYGCKGWVAHVFSNVWGFADPGWETSYGLNVTGGLWMASHLIEMYEYTLDKEFLAKWAYPILKGTAEFFLDYMVEDPKTGLILSGPAVSPENSFFVEQDGQKTEHSVCMSPTLDLGLLKDLFSFCVHAANTLGVDAELAQQMQKTNEKMPPFKVGSRHGQFQEWLDDFEEAQPYHRHLSHTMTLCRSALVSRRHTPDLADAIAVTLERRQDREDLEDIEFTAALFAMNYARLGDTKNALAQVGHLVGELSFDNLLSYSKPGVAGAEVNIFVVDGNFGGAAAVVEMLVRSLMRDGPGGEVEVDLLPCLPAEWPEGEVKGMKLRGNLETDFSWKEGKLTEVVMRAASDGKTVVYCGDKEARREFKAGDVIALDGSLQ